MENNNRDGRGMTHGSLAKGIRPSTVELLVSTGFVIHMFECRITIEMVGA
jgi:hypothetical protein